jgi:hypothetical protein
MCQRRGNRVTDRQITARKSGELADLTKRLGRVAVTVAVAGAERQDDHGPGADQTHELRDVPVVGQCGQRRGQAG